MCTKPLSVMVGTQRNLYMRYTHIYVLLVKITNTLIPASSTTNYTYMSKEHTNIPRKSISEVPKALSSVVSDHIER